MIDIVSLVLILAAAGAAAGVIAGLLGVGGGIVIVPVLFYLLPLADVPEDIRMHLAVGTSLATIIATSVVSARSHHKRGSVDVALLKRLVPGVVAGVVLGVILGGAAEGEELTAFFAVVALLVAGYMAFFKRDIVEPVRPMPRFPWLDGIGAVIGSISVAMGIGGGTLSVPIFSLFGVPVRRAVGTAAAIGFLIALPGTIGFAIAGWGEEGLPPGSVGYVSLLGFALIAPMSMAFAPLGAKLAHTIPSAWLGRIFAVFLAATSARMLLSL